MNILPYLITLLKYVIYGSTVFFTGELTKTTDTLDILALRFLLAFAVMWPLKAGGALKIHIGLRDIVGKKAKRPLVGSLLLAALFEPVLYLIFETVGISMTTNITAAVILSLSPIANCIVESIVLKEKNTFWQKVFLLMGIVGVLYISFRTDTGTGKDTVAGILLLFGAIIVSALYSAFSRKSSGEFSAVEITYVTSALGMVVFNVINVIRHLCCGTITSYFSPLCSAENIIGFVFLGVFATVLGKIMGNFALARMQISTMAAFSGVSTLVTILIGVIFAGEKLHDFHYIGLTLILVRMIGVSVISIRKDKRALVKK